MESDTEPKFDAERFATLFRFKLEERLIDKTDHLLQNLKWLQERAKDTKDCAERRQSGMKSYANSICYYTEGYCDEIERIHARSSASQKAADPRCATREAVRQSMMRLCQGVSGKELSTEEIVRQVNDGIEQIISAAFKPRPN